MSIQQENLQFQVPDRLAAWTAKNPTWTLGRILSQEKGQYCLLSFCGERQAVAAGKLQYEAADPTDFPAVGDYVAADLRGEGMAVIHQVLPRQSVFLRRAAGTAKSVQVVAANIDTLFLCMALNHDFNLRRLERYLSMAWDSGAVPVVVLTKSDLCADPAEKQLQAERVAVGAELVVTCALEDAYQGLLPYLAPGKTVAFVGSSGAGKSTLINRLLGEERQATKGLRNDDRGRHTTTRRQLFFLPDGAAVIDTPGMRELGMWNAGEGLSRTFEDIERLADSCRFSDCTHTREPGCAVRAALESGELEQERWLSYQKLMTENAYAADSAGYLEAKEKKFREIAKQNRKNRKRERK